MTPGNSMAEAATLKDIVDTATPYEGLDPDRILGAIESIGARPDGRLLALNSYENRVYQIGLDDGGALVAKFYRPARWSDAAILEEHAFARELAQHEIPVVPPLSGPQEATLHRYQGFRFAVYPRQGGRYPELDQPGHRAWIGRFIGRIHAVGAARSFVHRPVLSIERLGDASLHFLLEREMIPAPVRESYRAIAQVTLALVRDCFERAGTVRQLRLHGDCHPGNVLWTDDGPHFVDLDDGMTGPAIQDLWMLLSGDRSSMALQLAELLEGYTAFQDFDPRELHLVEALRTLRIIHYAAWIARRWDDPAFPKAFSWFGTQRYWEQEIVALQEQAALMNEPPLPWLWG
jgi:Ser/Thr protein kinase RdoA (MazF antagonist)